MNANLEEYECEALNQTMHAGGDGKIFKVKVKVVPKIHYPR